MMLPDMPPADAPIEYFEDHLRGIRSIRAATARTADDTTTLDQLCDERIAEVEAIIDEKRGDDEG